MNDHRPFNILDLPSDPFERREHILDKTIEIASRESTTYITKSYSKIELLAKATDFIDQDLTDAAPSDFDSFIKLKLFPWVEASKELDRSLSLIVLSFYKNSLDSMRRALELIVVGSFFILENQKKTESVAWLTSNQKTPQFRKMIKEIAAHHPYATCEAECSLTAFITSLYHSLSDYIHVKGIHKSQRKFHPSSHTFDGVAALLFNEASCKLTLDLFIQTTQTIALICALATPRLLIGFDLEKKFGLNPPLSGFFEEAQADRLIALIPEEFQLFMTKFRDSDPDLRSLKEWFDKLPDITNEEFKKQCAEFRKTYSSKD